MQKPRTTVTDIHYEDIKKTYSINGQNISICIQNGQTGMINGKRIILDETMVNNMSQGIINTIKNTATKYNPLPEQVIIKHNGIMNDQSQDVDNIKDEKGDTGIFECDDPKFSLDDVALNDAVRGQLNTAIAAVKHKRKMAEEWGLADYIAGDRAIVLNFYGKPGTGKSMAAEAIAKELGKKVYRINYSELESKYVGETPKNIRKAFAIATKDNALLIFDEADSFLGKRLTSVTQSADYGVNITRSVLLMELEKFTGVVVFTTNLISNYDEAFKRRILLSVYFDMPDEETRKQIWKLHIGKKLPLTVGVNEGSLAKRYEGISGADIKDMVFFAALRAIEEGKKELDFSVFDYSNASIKERYTNRETQQYSSIQEVTREDV